MGLEGDRQARIVMVTGSDSAEHHQRARTLGCDAVITKPIHRDDIIRLIKDWRLDKRSARTSRQRDGETSKGD